MNAVNQAVQGSIDATSSPSTEAEAFRQNWGREQGPVGAFQAASVMTPMTPGGSGGIFAVPLAGALRRGLPWLPAGSRIAGQGANGPIIAGLEDRFPDAVNWLRNVKTGDVPGVLSHPELGDRRVDLIFGKRGKDGFGVDHIDERHPDELEKLPKNWPSMRVEHEGPTRIAMKNDQAQLAIIPKDFEGDPKNWLLTFYKLNGDRPGSKLIDSASAQDRAGLFPDRSANPDLTQDWRFLNAVQEPASSVLSRTVSSALAGINPLSPERVASQQPADVPWLYPGTQAQQSDSPPPIFAAPNYAAPPNDSIQKWIASLAGVYPDDSKEYSPSAGPDSAEPFAARFGNWGSVPAGNLDVPLLRAPETQRTAAPDGPASAAATPAPSTADNSPAYVFDPTKPPQPFSPSNYASALSSVDKWIASLAGVEPETPTDFQVPPIFSPIYRR